MPQTVRNLGCVQVDPLFFLVRVVYGPRAFLTAVEFKAPRDRLCSRPLAPLLAGTAPLTLTLAVALTSILTVTVGEL